jgi:DNA invertase Pin-like site-specific DNA recombinase
MTPHFTRENKMQTKTVAAYVRVSSKGQNTDSQEQELTAWLRNNGYDLSQVEWYIDRASGKTLQRPEFDRMQRDIFDGKVKTVVCWKLDRLSRRLRAGVNLLAEWCDKGLKIIVTTQGIDLSGAVGKMIAAVMLGLAEIELEFRAERQAAGIRAAKHKTGKDKVYFGRKEGTTKAKPARALRLRNRGLNDSEIATALGTSVRTIQRYLRKAEAAV